MKELTRSYGDLLQDKRVRSEQAKYDSFTRQRNAVLSRYRKISMAFNDLIQGLSRAQSFYSEMKETVENLEKNVDTFVNNRREEGGQLLSQIERKKQSATSENVDREGERLRDLMGRMTVNPSPPQRAKSSASRSTPAPQQPQRSSQPSASAYSYTVPPTSPPYNAKPPTAAYPPAHSHSPAPPVNYPGYPPHIAQHPANGGAAYPDPHQRDPHHFHPAYDQQMQFAHYQQQQQQQQQPRSPPANQTGYPPGVGYPPYAQQLPPGLPHGYVPPPPPPGPPPGGQQFHYGQPPPRQGSTAPSGQQDPWAGLGAWR